MTKFVFKVYQKYGPELYHISSCEAPTLQQAQKYMSSYSNLGVEFIKSITPEGVEQFPKPIRHLRLIQQGEVK